MCLHVWDSCLCLALTAFSAALKVNGKLRSHRRLLSWPFFIAHRVPLELHPTCPGVGAGGFRPWHGRSGSCGWWPHLRRHCADAAAVLRVERLRPVRCARGYSCATGRCVERLSPRPTAFSAALKVNGKLPSHRRLLSWAFFIAHRVPLELHPTCPGVGAGGFRPCQFSRATPSTLV